MLQDFSSQFEPVLLLIEYIGKMNPALYRGYHIMITRVPFSNSNLARSAVHSAGRP
jgi:hypothetical protein